MHPVIVLPDKNNLAMFEKDSQHKPNRKSKVFYPTGILIIDGRPSDDTLYSCTRCNARVYGVEAFSDHMIKHHKTIVANVAENESIGSIVTWGSSTEVLLARIRSNQKKAFQHRYNSNLLKRRASAHFKLRKKYKLLKKGRQTKMSREKGKIQVASNIEPAKKEYHEKNKRRSKVVKRKSTRLMEPSSRNAKLKAMKQIQKQMCIRKYKRHRARVCVYSKTAHPRICKRF